jgi:hypothetical protein
MPFSLDIIATMRKHISAREQKHVALPVHFCLSLGPRHTQENFSSYYLGLFIYPMNPIAALPNLVRLSL